MKTSILVSTTPNKELCVLYDVPNYRFNASLEARTYKDQLLRTHGKNPSGSSLRITSSKSNGLVDYAIRFHYDSENQRHIIYLEKLDEGCQHWDKQAKKRLVKKGYPFQGIITKPNSKRYDRFDDEGYTYDNGPTGHGDICWSDADPGL